MLLFLIPHNQETYYVSVMDKTKFKVESGVQLLTRLSTKKTKVGNFYPNLFPSDPNPGEVIEIFSNRSSSFLLIDIICEAILPAKFGGHETGVLVLSTDGHISLQALTTSLQKKLKSRYNFGSSEVDYTKVLNDMLVSLYILDIFDATQLYTTLQNLDNVLTKHNNISLCVIDTLTAFYWSEQSFKITKLDVYLKNLLRIIQKSVHGHDQILIYTRPEYFNSGKDSLENLEAVVETPTAEKVNFRVQLVQNDDETFTTNVMTYNNIARRNFNIRHNEIIWL